MPLNFAPQANDLSIEEEHSYVRARKRNILALNRPDGR